MRRLKQLYDGPVYCILQGDDVFLDELMPPVRRQAIERISASGGGVRRVPSPAARSTATTIASYLQLPSEEFFTIPLSIDASELPVRCGVPSCGCARSRSRCSPGSPPEKDSII